MQKLKSYLWWYGSALVFLAVFMLPLIKPGWFAKPLFENHEHWQTAAKVVLLGLPFLAARLAFSGSQLPASERRWAWFLCIAATCICEVVHYWATDRGHYFPSTQYENNTAWEAYLHKGIMELQPGFIPHSYRFLPDCIVTVFTWLGNNFVCSRIAYRLLFNGLLFVAIYRYGRIYLSSLFAGGLVLVVTAIYPTSITNYAGQFVDPASHFSFAVCLFSLARNYESAFGPNLFVGLFSKESVIVMALCRLFTGTSRWRSLAMTVVYLSVAVAITLGIRLFVNHGHMQYDRISGVGLGQVVANLSDYCEWGPSYLATFGMLLPGAIGGWRLMDRTFRFTGAVVVAAVLVSSLLFSWLGEVRNMMPAFTVLALLNMKYVQSRFGTSVTAAAATGPLTA